MSYERTGMMASPPINLQFAIRHPILHPRIPYLLLHILRWKIDRRPFRRPDHVL